MIPLLVHNKSLEHPSMLVELFHHPSKVMQHSIDHFVYSQRDSAWDAKEAQATITTPVREAINKTLCVQSMETL